jgi:hypothetical protein
MITYKIFEKDLSCKEFKYEVGKEYKQKDIKICKKGFHSCKNPFDIFSFYNILDDKLNIRQFAIVEAIGKIIEQEDKICSSILKISSIIGLKELTQEFVNIIINNTKRIFKKGNKDSAKIGSSGDCAKIGSSGSSAKIWSSGHSAKIGNSGNYAQIGSSGNYAQIGSSGNYDKIGSSGDSAQIGSSGDSAKIGSSGDSAKIGSSGDSAQIGSSGKDAVISAIGINSQIKAKKGSWIVLAEYNKDRKPIIVLSVKIDEKKYKEDVVYTIKNKKIVQVKED